jgi:hypothetical protein
MKRAGVDRLRPRELPPIDLSKSAIVPQEFIDNLMRKSRDHVELPPRTELEAMDGVSSRTVYFVMCCEFLKIGVATDVGDRISALQVGCPFPLTLLGTIRGGVRAETALHAALRAYHARGEWFSSPPLVRKAIRRLLGIDDQGRQR